MLSSYATTRLVLPAFLLLASVGAVQAQAPVITTVVPMANAHAVSRTSPVTVNFSQPLTAASAGALKVYSSQRGGLRTRSATPAVVTGSTLSFTPTAYPFMPGETVNYTVTTAAAGSNGTLAQPRVGQFTTATGGNGRGIFSGGQDISLGIAKDVALNDLDEDGDLDMLIITSSAVSVQLNNGNGTFNQGISYAMSPLNIILGDIDSDGDSDMLIMYPAAVEAKLNNGNGSFGSSRFVSNINGTCKALNMGDLDGDGDLDMLITATPIQSGSPGTVSILLNNGSGIFSRSQSLNVGPVPLSTTVGDVDADGDLDFVTSDYGFSIMVGNTVSVRINNGQGTFSGNQEVTVGNRPDYVALNDMDGDGDLDMLTANSTSNTVSVRLNGGNATGSNTGIFSSGTDLAVGTGPIKIGANDVDGDGDLDLFVLHASNGASTVSIRINDGSGNFSGNQSVVVGYDPKNMVLGDIDGDSDLDIVTSNSNINSLSTASISVRLNGNTALSAAISNPATNFTIFPNPTQRTTTLTGAVPHAPIAVLDALGRLVTTATANAVGTVHLGLPSGIAAGVYLVRSGEQVRRLIVE